MSKQPLVIFSPLPPVENGIADYTATFLADLGNIYRCTAVIDNGSPWPTNLPSSIEVYRLSAFLSRRDHFKRAQYLFHIGNNPDHSYMIEPLNEFGGIVVLHDPSIHYLLDTKYFHNSFDRQIFRRILWRDHGKAGLTIANQALRDGWATDTTHADFPVLGLALNNARSVIVHSQFALNRVQSYYPTIPITIIPHYAKECGRDRMARRLSARDRLSLSQDTAVILTLGFINRAKQITAILDALLLIKNSQLRVCCLIVGKDTNDGPSLYSEIIKRQLTDIVQCIGYAPDELIDIYLDASDLLINLRYPTQGETSGTVSRALGRGVCTIVSNHGWFAELPDEVVVKLPAVPHQPHVIAATMLYYISKPEEKRRVEQAALDYAEGELNLQSIVQKYRSFIDLTPKVSSKFCSGVEPINIAVASRPDKKRISETAKLFGDDCLSPGHAEFCGALWWTEGLLPLQTAHLRTYGPFRLREFTRAVFASELDSAYDVTIPCDLGLCVGKLEHFAANNFKDILAFLGGVTTNGYCVFNVWHDLAPADAIKQSQVLLETADFEVLHCVDRPTSMIEPLLLDTFPLEICILARKVRSHDVRDKSCK